MNGRRIHEASQLTMLRDMQEVMADNRRRAKLGGAIRNNTEKPTNTEPHDEEADDVGHIVLGDAYFGDRAIKAKEKRDSAAARQQSNRQIMRWWAICCGLLVPWIVIAAVAVYWALSSSHPPVENNRGQVILRTK